MQEPLPGLRRLLKSRIQMFGWIRKRTSSPPPTYPDPQSWEHATGRQRDRAGRSFAELLARHAPVFQGPLVVDDDEDVTVRSAQEVAQRVMVLWAVDMKAEGVDQSNATRHLDVLNLDDAVSPKEREFFDDPNPDPGYCQSLVWRLESIWILLWALGCIKKPGWPFGMCNTKVMVPLLEKSEQNPKFISKASLRSKSEILDQRDLTMRIHWAIRDSYLNGRPLPGNLNWARPDDWLAADSSAAVGVVEQRHYALNWLCNFMDADWDNVDTPT